MEPKMRFVFGNRGLKKFLASIAGYKVDIQVHKGWLRWLVVATPK